MRQLESSLLFRARMTSSLRFKGKRVVVAVVRWGMQYFSHDFFLVGLTVGWVRLLGCQCSSLVWKSNCYGTLRDGLTIFDDLCSLVYERFA
jgi:hypothetical protein